jgi:hypothetical protein
MGAHGDHENDDVHAHDRSEAARIARIRSHDAADGSRRAGADARQLETTIKGVSTSVKWRCTACEAVFPASKRKAV